ncbi:hypothetical protein CA260_06095 [Dyella jiangningensis]|uniref:DUF4412 domain-containing protein n=2 Tax=Dyella jiangningensis TaxID=1379159 RepID=A0A328PAR0_9GAMM|nr:hypothetical protein CA260_06095 [Dyella jiangningensis]
MRSHGLPLRGLALLVMACALPRALAADEAKDIKLASVITGDGIRSSTASVSREGSMVTTTWLSGDKVRVDFDAGPGMRGRILRDKDHAWLIRPNSHQAIPAGGVAIGRVTRLDPKRPCWDLGFPCQELENKTIAGRQATGWRYRHAERSGPQGTDQGEFWIDAATGVVLAFDARDLAEHRYRMQTVSFEQVTLDDAVFAVPKSVTLPTGRWGR